MFFSAMMGPTLVWLWFCSLRRIAGFATQSTWVASNATGCLDDPYYFDVFFLNLGEGSCRLDESDTTGDGRGTVTRYSSITSLQECLDICFDISHCTGVEYSANTNDCEIWNQTIGYVRTIQSVFCIGMKEVDCKFMEGKNCTAQIYDKDATEEVEEIKASCPNACLEVQPVCPANFVARNTNLGGIYLTSAGEEMLAKEQYSNGYNLLFNVKGAVSAESGSLELTALSTDGSTEEIEDRASYLTSRLGAKLLLGPYGDNAFEAVAEVAQEAKAVLVGPMSRQNASVATRNMVFSLTRPYEDMLLAPFQAIRQKGVATVSYIGPSEKRAESLLLEDNFRTCQVLSQTAQRAELVFLRGEELDDVSADGWSKQVADAVQRLVTPRPDVIVCCDSSYVCVTQILNATRRIPYDMKGFIILDDQHLSLALNRATVDVWATTTQDVHLWLQARLLEMGRHQTLAEVDMWGASSYYTMIPWSGPNAWTNELVEMMKDCLVVSSWDRNSAAAAGFMYFQHYQVRNHPRPEAAAAWSAGEVLLEAIRLANSTDPQAVATQLMSLQMHTVFGNVSFDHTGYSTQPTSMMQFTTKIEWMAVDQLIPDLRFLSGPRAVPLRYPKPPWRESYCFNRHLAAPDGFIYGLVRNNETGHEDCVTCNEGEMSSWDPRRARRYCEICPPGTKIHEGRCERCEEGHYSDEAGSVSCKSCDAGTFQDREGKTACLPCPAGSFSSQAASSRCTDCRDTFDASNPASRPHWSPEGSTQCQTCMDGASCEPDSNGIYSNFTNSDGYYLFPAELVHKDAILKMGYPLFRCNHGHGLACRKGGQCYVDPESGEEAMTGPMCGSCLPGYAKPIGQPLEVCRKCGPRIWSWVGVMLQFGTILCMALFLMTVNFVSDYSKPKNILSIILKQLFNYIQMASVVLSTGGAHGLYGGLSVLDSFELAQDYLGVGSAAWVPESGACLIQELLPSWGVNKVLTIVGLSWFPCTAIVSTFVFLLIKALRKLVGGKNTDSRHLKTWLMVNFFLFIPRVNRLLLVNFKCQTYDTSRLSLDPSVACWGSEHSIWQTLSWCGIVVFSLGGPLFLYLLLRRLHNMQLLSTYKILRTYGFLFAGFEPDFYYFECVYIFRKLCFELVMNLPGMTSEDEEILGRINSSSVAFVASIFFALHMACQPYDNRDYFLLDHIETASLRAILITAFLQLWCLNTNEADGIYWNVWLRELRNTICTAVILAFHLRFWWLIFYGIGRRRIQSCVATCRGRASVHGMVKFVPDGLQLHNLSSMEERLMRTLVAEIFEMHMQSKRRISFDQWSGSLQMLCLEARRQHVENELLALDKVGNTIRSWREICQKLFNHNRFGLWCERALDRMQSAYGLVSKVGGIDNSKKLKEQELEDLKVFNAESMNKILNKEFRVDELQDAMLSLGKSICDYKCVNVGLGNFDEDSLEPVRPKQNLEFYVGPMDMDDRNAMALHERSSIKELEELRNEVDERKEECAELRRLLSRARSKAQVDVIPETSQAVDLEDMKQALEEVNLQREALQAQKDELFAEVEKHEDSKEEARGVIEQQRQKIHALEEQWRKEHQHRMTCWACRAKLPEDATYCSKCGKALCGEV